MMSRRAFVARLLITIQGTVLVGIALLILSVFYLLDLSPEGRQTQLQSHVLYGVGASVFMSGLILWRMRPVLQVLGMWDRGIEPPEDLLSAAQMRALTYPSRFIGEAALVVLVVNAVGLYVDTQTLGYELGQELINIALTVAFALAIVFVVNVGLRMLLRGGVLRRIALPPQSDQGRASVILQFGLATALLGLTLLLFGGVFTYSTAVNLMEQGVAEERARWLNSDVLPDAAALDIDDRVEYIAQRTRPGEIPFFVDRSGLVVSEAALPYGLTPEQVHDLGWVMQPYLYKQDYSTLRVLAVPLGAQPVLCIAYRSEVGTSPALMQMIRVLAFFSLGGLLFAIAMGTSIGSNLANITNHVVRRLDQLAEQEQAMAYAPIAQTSLDEIGDLVRAFNRIQRRTEAYTTQLKDSVAQLEAANAERRALLETMVGLAAPVIPVSEGLVVVPLAGYFDADRAAHIRPNLLAGIAAQRARIVVIDLTGVSEATEFLADHLARATRSAALMGCQIILTGAGPDVAWSLTEMSTELESLSAHRNLEEGLVYAQAQLRAN
jgi:anti-anti-sigma regulatory factor